MTTLLGIYLFVLAIGLVVMMFVQHQRGTCEMLSIRNVALLGFIVFQVTSGASALIWNDYGRRAPHNPLVTGIEFTAMTTVFIIVALWSYNGGWLVKRWARSVPTPRAAPSDFGLLVLATVLTVFAFGLRFGVQVLLAYKLTEQIGQAFAAMACGMIGWVWGRRLFNPMMGLYMLAIVAANITIVISAEFGRRGLVAVTLAVLWGMFYSAFRYMPTKQMIRRLGVLSLGPFLILAVFTAVRSGKDKDRSALEYLQIAMSGAPIREGIYELLHGQDCAPVSMWLIERHPQDFPYRHLMTIRWFMMYPIPRDWWPGKPYPMAQLWVDMANVSGVARTLNVGPGIVGSAGCEGGWYALFIYAVVGGLALRLLDEIVMLHVASPIIVLSVGSALGDTLGLARGETGTFAAKAVIMIGSCLIFVLGAYRFLEASGMFGDISADELVDDDWPDFDEVDDEGLHSDQPGVQRL